jgi:antitoxin component YwqK of YwqJK toxin-antitoxin module
MKAAQEKPTDGQVDHHRHRALRIRVALMIALALFAAVWMMRRGSHRAGAQPLEVLRAELHLQNGRLHRPGDTNTFSGLMIERYSDGAFKSRTAVVEGLLHGLSEGWFTNGLLQVREQFTRGVSHGLRTKWYPSGKKLSEAQIIDGHFEGTFRKWHENGTLAERIEFINGQPAGVSLAYFKSGFLKARARLEAGKVVEQQFWTDGEAEKAVSQETAIEPQINDHGRR